MSNWSVCNSGPCRPRRSLLWLCYTTGVSHNTDVNQILHDYQQMLLRCAGETSQHSQVAAPYSVGPGAVLLVL